MSERPIAVGDPDAPIAAVVLHGREMCGADLAPFAAPLANDAYWIFPDAPLAAGRGRSWWPAGPHGRVEARAHLDGILATVHQPFVLAGFSQGGMLAMDYVLHGGRRPAALALLSSTRIAIADWTACARTGILADLPILVAHGTGDAELAFTAGEQLRDFATAHGAAVQWLPFDGGHQLPFVVWRALRKLVGSMRRRA
ncbi:MAG TPA: hypothetical protein VGL61_03290 [Kofleriaceae bacterium]|jgi:phospholipase/carboxylesterase